MGKFKDILSRMLRIETRLRTAEGGMYTAKNASDATLHRIHDRLRVLEESVSSLGKKAWQANVDAPITVAGLRVMEQRLDASDQRITSTKRELEALGEQVRLMTTAVGGLWMTAAGDVLPIRQLSDTHLNMILAGGYGSQETRDLIRAERKRRNDDDAWAVKYGRRSLRDRVKDLEDQQRQVKVNVAPPATLREALQSFRCGGQSPYGQSKTSALLDTHSASVRRAVPVAETPSEPVPSEPVPSRETHFSTRVWGAINNLTVAMSTKPQERRQDLLSLLSRKLGVKTRSPLETSSNSTVAEFFAGRLAKLSSVQQSWMLEYLREQVQKRSGQ